eukprot:391796-Pyramimonas_sp.AAC.1
MARADLFGVIAWAARRLLLIQPFLVHENAVGFPVGILELPFPMHTVESLVVDLGDLGFPSARSRRIILMRRMSTTRNSLPP